MMFNFLLNIHSLLRWLVLLSILTCIIRGFYGWISGDKFKKSDKTLIFGMLISSYVQLFIGFILYMKSPLVAYFLKNFSTAVHQRDFRFFGMEHITAMSLSILLLSLASYKIIGGGEDSQRFKKMALWFGLAFLIIFLSVPWSFSPFTSRPDFRLF